MADPRRNPVVVSPTNHEGVMIDDNDVVHHAPSLPDGITDFETDSSPTATAAAAATAHEETESYREGRSQPSAASAHMSAVAMATSNISSAVSLGGNSFKVRLHIGTAENTVISQLGLG